MRKLFTLGIFCLCLLTSAYAQGGKAQGKVINARDGAPIVGASVNIKGVSKRTQTDENGLFSIDIPGSQAVLEITSVGFSSVSQTVTAGKMAEISMLLENKELSEVVVTGTGVATSKKKLAIAVESITADKLPAMPTADVGGALVGKIAGAQISSINGSPGAPVNILLRGINTINQGTSPMILVDGVQVNTGLERLDLAAYDRIEVVQGAAAASIFGAQGANGVIQLFTKRGKQGKVNIDLSSSVAVNELINVGNVNKARKHAFAVNANGEVINGAGAPLTLDPATGSYLTNPVFNLINPNSKFSNEYGKNLLWYDHYKMNFQQSTTINNSISINGSKDKMDFNIIGSDNRQSTVFKGNGDFSRTNLTVNLGAELMKGLRFRSITQLINTVNRQLDPTGRDMFYATNNGRPFGNFEQLDPTGQYAPYLGDAVGVNHYNFKYIQQNAEAKDKRLDVVQSFNLNYKFPKFVELDAKYGINYYNGLNRYEIAKQTSLGADFWQYQAEYYSPRPSYHDPANLNSNSGEINQGNYTQTSQNLNANTTIRFSFEDDFKLNIPLQSTTIAGWDYRSRAYKEFITYGGNAPVFSPFTASDMGVFKVVSDYVENFNTYGYYLSQRFDWSDWAGVSIGLRSDFSSAFGQGSKPQTFPRGDAYVRISELDFFKNSSIKSFWTDLKLRAAYGEAGIQPGAYDRFPTLGSLTIGTQSSLFTPVSNANPNLRVEVSKELEIGTDMAFRFSNSANWLRSLNFSVTYWSRKSEDVIDRVDVAPSQGFGRVLTNSIDIKSDGIQASLNIGVYSSKNFNWNSTTNFSKQTSVVDKVLGDAEIIKTSNAGSTQYVIKAGEKVGQIYGFLFLNAVNQLDPNGNEFIPKADQGLYEVASNGYVVNKTSRQPFASPSTYALGDPNPKFNMSFINDFSYKGYLSFGFQLDWVYKSTLYNQTKQWMYRDGIHKDYDNEITIDGQTAAWSSFYRGAYAVRRANGTKSYFYEDASFLRLRNLYVAFDFAKCFSIKGFTRLQLVLTGRNIFTITNYTGFDPEVSSGGNNSAWDRAVDHNTIPNLKTYQVGLNIGF